MIEAAFRQDGKKHPTSTGDRLLPAVDEQVCPRCGRETYRTGASIRLEPSPDQSCPWVTVECASPVFDKPSARSEGKE